MEATMIMLDNSESSINGDYAPTRWDQQVEAVNLLIEGKIADSAQASVGLGIMSGKRVEVLCAPTNNSAKLTAYLFGIPIYGEIRLKEAIKTALLAMKNRQNTNQRQRIICLITSTINDSEEDLLWLGKQLKKDAVNLDLIVCGDQTLPEFAGQRKRVEAVMEGLKSTESLVLWVPNHIHIRDAITSSSIFVDRAGENVVPNVPAGGAGNNEDRIDPNIDPQLAMVLEASRKEYEEFMKKANEAQPKPQVPAEKKTAQQQQDQDAEMQRRAIELSLQEQANVQAELEQKKKEEEEKKGKEEPKKEQPSGGLGQKHGDFISEFQKMDEEDDEEAKLKKKDEKK